MSGEFGEPRVLYIRRRRNEDGEWEVEGKRVDGAIECPRCGEWRETISDVDGWECATGEVDSWGPGLVECCGLLLVNGWQGAEAYKLDG